jgi:hypothetical protein
MRDARTLEEVSDICGDLLPHFRSWAPRIAASYSSTAVADADDVVSLCAETTYHLLTDKRPTTEVLDWYRYVYGSCRKRAASHFQSAAVTAMSGMTELMRSRQRAGEHDVVSEDLPGDWSIAELLEHDSPTTEMPDFVLSEVEGRELVQMVIEACYEHGDELGQVADAWIGDVYSEPPVVSSGADIGRSVGITNARALTLLGRARRVAAEVCEEEFGLTGIF